MKLLFLSALTLGVVTGVGVGICEMDCGKGKYCFKSYDAKEKCKSFLESGDSCSVTAICGEGLACAKDGKTKYSRVCESHIFEATMPPTKEPKTKEPTKAPKTKKPTKAPKTKKPTKAPKVKKTKQPTQEPTMQSIPDDCAVPCVDTAIEMADGFCCKSDVCCQKNLNDADDGFLCCENGSKCTKDMMTETQACFKELECTNACGDIKGISSTKQDGNCCDSPDKPVCCSKSGDGEAGSFMCCKEGESCVKDRLTQENVCKKPITSSPTAAVAPTSGRGPAPSRDTAPSRGAPTVGRPAPSAARVPTEAAVRPTRRPTPVDRVPTDAAATAPTARRGAR